MSRHNIGICTAMGFGWFDGDHLAMPQIHPYLHTSMPSCKHVCTCNTPVDMHAYIHLIEGSLDVKPPTYDICSNSGDRSQTRERVRRRVRRKKSKASARSKYWRQNVKNASGSEHVWTLRCRRSARRCGAKRVSKSKWENKPGPDHFCILLGIKMSKKCTPLWFRSQKSKSTPLSEHFWQLTCWKSARRCDGANQISKAKSQNTTCSDHFWRLGCQKSAGLCGAKHIRKSKVLKTDGLGPLLEVRTSKKCTPAAKQFASQKCYKLTVSHHLWKLRCLESACLCGAKHARKSKALKTDGLGPLLAGQASKKCTALWRDRIKK